MRIAITGATGFVGCRLAERLVLGQRHEVVGLIRRFSGAGLARLARLPVRLALIDDITDSKGLRRAFDGCDAVVHCAYGTTGSPEERYRDTVEGTASVLAAAAESGVRRVIHLSSTVVHGLPRKGVIDETAPFAHPRTEYDRMKLEAEKAVWSFHRDRGFPVVVLRPPLVYGPYGRRWTTRIFQELLRGATLVDGGAGVANFVYVDNLVDLILIASSGSADGEAIITVDDTPRTWRDVYEGYHGLLRGAPPIRSRTSAEIRQERKRLEPGRVRGSLLLPLQLAPRLAREATSSREVRKELNKVPWVRGLAALTRPYRARQKAVHLQPEVPAEGRLPAYPLPDRQAVELQTARGRYSGDRAQALLGGEVGTSWVKGLRLIGEWAAYQRVGTQGSGTA